MYRLLILLWCLGCAGSEPTAPRPTYYLRFARDIDSLFVMRNGQTFKLLTVETNLPNQTKVGWESNILVKVRTSADVPTADTVSTVNCCSYTHNGYVKTVFGGFDMLRGKTALITVTTRVQNTLIADTLQLVLY
jgi:hypothetical protein